MSFRNLTYLFFSTLLVGGLGSIVLSLFLDSQSLLGGGLINAVYGLIGHMGAGFLFSLVAQMGFFAYLAIHSFGLGFFRSLWGPVQLVLIGFTFFDMVYLRYNTFAQQGESFFSFILLPLLLLLYALGVAYFKVRQTNSKAAIPTVFLLFVVTIIEWVPALNKNNLIGMIHMLVPLLLCNTWQVMQLHRLTSIKTQPDNSEQRKELPKKKKKAQ